MRKASVSPSKRAPSGVAVPVRRATCPSTVSRTSATEESATTAATGSGRSAESATRPATPAASSARVRVTQSAGGIPGVPLRIRPTASSAVVVQPVGEVDQLTAGELAAADRQPVGQAGGLLPVVPGVLDRLQDDVQERCL